VAAPNKIQPNALLKKVCENGPSGRDKLINGGWAKALSTSNQPLMQRASLLRATRGNKAIRRGFGRVPSTLRLSTQRDLWLCWAINPARRDRKNSSNSRKPGAAVKKPQGQSSKKKKKKKAPQRQGGAGPCSSKARRSAPRNGKTSMNLWRIREGKKKRQKNI